ncbi:MAG: hypothetical protein M3Y87_35645 [Myxococcota bacterium]|nr:hypothetical protein [Myxococcota bacterium]
MLYPRTGELPGAEDCDLDAFLVRFRRESPALMWLGVVMGAVIFHLTPLMTVFVPLPAFLLPRSLRDRHAYRITSGGLYLTRQSVFLLKLAAGLCWGAHPSVRERFALAAQPSDPGTWRASFEDDTLAPATAEQTAEQRSIA